MYSEEGSITRNERDGNSVANALVRLNSKAAHTMKQRKKASTRHPERNSPSSLIKMYLATSCRSRITQRLYRWVGIVSIGPSCLNLVINVAGSVARLARIPACHITPLSLDH